MNEKTTMYPGLYSIRPKTCSVSDMPPCVGYRYIKGPRKARHWEMSKESLFPFTNSKQTGRVDKLTMHAAPPSPTKTRPKDQRGRKTQMPESQEDFTPLTPSPSRVQVKIMGLWHHDMCLF